MTYDCTKLDILARISVHSDGKGLETTSGVAIGSLSELGCLLPTQCTQNRAIDFLTMPQQRQRTVGKVAVVAFKSWGPKRTEIYIELTFHSHLPTPLLPAPTLSEGEYKVSSGELKVSGRVSLPRNPRA